jgi:hypothetical protein
VSAQERSPQLAEAREFFVAEGERRRILRRHQGHFYAVDLVERR